jgi:hypothetical protein
MPFTLKNPESGLFWSTGIFGRVQLGPVPNVYTLEGSYIKNVKTGNYVNHVADILHEGGAPEEFVIGDDGVISSQGKVVISGSYLHLMGGEPTSWVKVDEAPITRGDALLKEASKKCECGSCECDPCECGSDEESQ